MKKLHLVKCGFLIPQPGRSHAVPNTDEGNRWIKNVDRLETQLVKIFGGFTDEGIVKGAWLNPRTQLIEREYSKRYVVAVKPGDVDKLWVVLVACLEVFNQQAIYWEVEGRAGLIHKGGMNGEGI